MNDSSQPIARTQGQRTAQGQRGLDPRYCLDEAIYWSELEKLFDDAWIPVGYASQLTEPGSFFRANIHGCDGVVLRDRQQHIRAFQNVCRHRGTQLCVEPAGQLNSALVCPYHGWKYDFEGNLVSAPNMQSVDGFDRHEYGLGEFAVVNWQGLLLANHPTVEQTPPVFALDAVAGDYQLARYQWVRSVDYDVAANWKLLFQNFNECYHCPSVHPQLTPVSDYRDASNDFESGAVLGGPMTIRKSARTISTDREYCGQPPKHLKDDNLRYARYYTIFPNLFVSLFPDYAMLHRIRPVAVDRTRIVCDFLFPPEAIQGDGFQPEKAIDFWDLTNRQDWEMCERVQVGIATPGFAPSPYSDLESLLVAFDRHYRARMEA